MCCSWFQILHDLQSVVILFYQSTARTIAPIYHHRACLQQTCWSVTLVCQPKILERFCSCCIGVYAVKVARRPMNWDSYFCFAGADREAYYYGRAKLFETHPDIISVLCRCLTRHCTTCSCCICFYGTFYFDWRLSMLYAWQIQVISILRISYPKPLVK